MFDLKMLPWERRWVIACCSEAPRPQGGASGKCSYDYTVDFDSTAGVRFRPPRPCSRKAGHPADLPVSKGSSV